MGGTADKILKLFIDGSNFFTETLLENIFGTEFCFLNSKSNLRFFFIPKYFIFNMQKTLKNFVPKLSPWHSYSYLIKFFIKQDCQTYKLSNGCMPRGWFHPVKWSDENTNVLVLLQLVYSNSRCRKVLRFFSLCEDQWQDTGPLGMRLITSLKNAADL